jgi:hypothetical protein
VAYLGATMKISDIYRIASKTQMHTYIKYISYRRPLSLLHISFMFLNRHVNFNPVSAVSVVKIGIVKTRKKGTE